MWKRWNGNKIIRQVNKESLKAVEKTGHVVITAGKQQVPLDEGFLLRSGLVFVIFDKMPIAILSFGGGQGTGHPKIPYAIKWHETQANFQHGRKWKYLIDPFNTYAKDALKKFLLQDVGGVLG